MTRFIGGPLNGEEREIDTEFVSVSVWMEDRAPKEIRHDNKRGYLNCTYRRFKYVANGRLKLVYRFVDGYYYSSKRNAQSCAK